MQRVESARDSLHTGTALSHTSCIDVETSMFTAAVLQQKYQPFHDARHMNK